VGGAAPGAAGDKAVEVRPLRYEAHHIDVDRMGVCRRRQGLPLAGDAGEALVVRHLPAHGNGIGAHAAILVQRARSKPRPQHHPVMKRIARGDAEGERVVAERPARPHRAADGAERTRRRQGQPAAEQASAVGTDETGISAAGHGLATSDDGDGSRHCLQIRELSMNTREPGLSRGPTGIGDRRMIALGYRQC
jgi:hypothetical protein